MLLPSGHDADKFRENVLQNYNMSVGNGLSKLSGKVFRIGHLGHFNDLMLVATLGGIEMALWSIGIPHQAGGTSAAMLLPKEKNTNSF